MEKLGLETLITASDSESGGENSDFGGDGTRKTAATPSRRGVTGAKGRFGGSCATDTRKKSVSSAKNGKAAASRAVRPDLGTVLGSVPASATTTKESAPSQSGSTLGTLSSLLFGRKGGLL